ncbi:hypothetical protein [Bradyrhizobium sp.]|uniref:hypothetical protein n=1 Tax=Bradyrhizobium sp. TaxID=376 RepID=UPI0025C71112|nr:hypothetical protein [Bradyrhizobium sp.]
MTHINADTTDLHPLFHPAAHYDSPTDVLNDEELTTPEKRIILSSWASDMYAVESCPGLREVPGMDHTVRLADILAALRQLDGDDDPPAPGGVPMRLRRPWAAAAECQAMPRESRDCARPARPRISRVDHSLPRITRPTRPPVESSSASAARSRVVW